MERIQIKEAVSKAVKFLSDLQPGKPPEDVIIDEVELSEDGQFWNITISFFPGGSSISRLADQEIERLYRIFKIDVTTGDVISMKIRTL